VEAVSLVALSAGLGTSVLGGQTTVDEALAIIGYHLDRLLGPVGAGRAGLSPGPSSTFADGPRPPSRRLVLSDLRRMV
jgi:hypothetical protein